MAADYEDAVSGYAKYEFPEVSVSGSTFGDVDLAMWFTAITEQFDNAGLAIHAQAQTIADGLRVTAREAQRADDASRDDLDKLRADLPAPRSDLEGLLLGPLTQDGSDSAGPYGGLL